MLFYIWFFFAKPFWAFLLINLLLFLFLHFKSSMHKKLQWDKVFKSAAKAAKVVKRVELGNTQRREKRFSHANSNFRFFFLHKSRFCFVSHETRTGWLVVPNPYDVIFSFPRQYFFLTFHSNNIFLTFLSNIIIFYILFNQNHYFIYFINSTFKHYFELKQYFLTFHSIKTIILNNIFNQNNNIKHYFQSKQ